MNRITDEQQEYLENSLCGDIIALIKDPSLQDWADEHRELIAKILCDSFSFFGKYPEKDPSGKMQIKLSYKHKRWVMIEIKVNRWAMGLP